jgi:hypothetical protein
MSIRLETLGGIATPVLLRGTPLPAERVETFSTAEDNQVALTINLVIGERPLVAKCVKIGSVTLKGIPPAAAGKPQVRVTLSVDRECAVSVTCSVDSIPSTGDTLRAEQKFLRAKMIDKIRADAEVNRVADEGKVSLIEVTNRATALVRQAEQSLASERKKNATTLNLNAINEAIAGLGRSLEAGLVDEIRQASNTLDALLRPNDYSNFFNTPSVIELFGSSKRQSNSPSRSSDRLTSQKKGSRQKSHDGVGGTRTADSKSSRLGRIFGGIDFTLDANLCFVLMPFDTAFRSVYNDHIKPAISATGLNCQRADEIHSANLITVDIWEKINRARFVVADLTNRNPNVFYEVGLAHAIGKDVILLTQNIADVPFDLRNIRCIRYDLTADGLKKLGTQLRQTVDTVVKTP